MGKKAAGGGGRVGRSLLRWTSPRRRRGADCVPRRAGLTGRLPLTPPQYRDGLARGGVDGALLAELTEEELEGDLGVGDPAHRAAILAWLRALPP